jgi:hypothetical protein
MFFVLRLYFTKEINAVKKIQGLGHPTAPGRYMIESGHFKDCLLYIWERSQYGCFGNTKNVCPYQELNDDF